MKLYPGFGDLTGRLARLHESQFGPKQALGEFQELLTINFIDNGFEQCVTNTCVFGSWTPVIKAKMILLYHVDDRSHGCTIDLCSGCPRETSQYVLRDKSFGGTRALRRMLFCRELRVGNLDDSPEVSYREDGGMLPCFDEGQNPHVQNH